MVIALACGENSTSFSTDALAPIASTDELSQAGVENAVDELSDGTVAIWEIETSSSGLLVAVGGLPNQPAGNVFTSTNGKDWFERFHDETCRPWSIATSGEIWMAVGSSSRKNEDVCVLTSQDAIHWTRIEAPGLLKHTYEVVWAGEQFVVSGFEKVGEFKIWTTPDGDLWVGRGVLPFPAYFLGFLASSQGVVVASGWGLATSVDHGLTWQSADEEMAKVTGANIWAIPNGFAGITVGLPCSELKTDCVHAVTSSGGVSWSRAEVSQDLMQPNVAQIDAGGISIGIRRGGLVTKRNGSDWREVMPSTFGIQTIANLDNIFVAGGHVGLLWSVDGTSWVDANVPNTR